MKKYLNLSIIASLVMATLTCQVALAKSSQSALNKDVVDESSSEKVKLYINSQQRSLYQIALLSGVSVAELRELNKGAYDKVDIVKVGESIILPTSSPLLPAEDKSNTNLSNKYELPQLGSSDKGGTPKQDDALERHIATALSTLGSQDWENMSSEKVKSQVQDDAQQYAENYVRNQVQSQLVDPIRSAAQDFLGRFGTAQLGFNVSDEGRLNNVSLKLFSPWYDSDNTLIFSQMSFQEYEDNRRIGNFGVGQRWDVADKSWLLGYNVFLDHDFQRAHNRLGLGLEAWSDYMKLAVNYYYPLSDWKNSRDFENYLERAARGFDVRFQGYLPSYPHLGGSLMFEQYFGDEVALFGKDNLQKDPYAVTVGVDYTPVPLFTLRGEHKQGQDSQTDAKIDLTMNYRIGVPLKDQLDPDMVAAAHSLRGSRYDLVDRNNNIVLEYKENKLSVDLASIGEQPEQTLFPVGIMVRGAKGAISSITWNGTDLARLLADGGDLCYNRSGATVNPGDPVVACPAGNVWNAITTTDYNNWSIAVPSFTNAMGVRNPAPGTTKTDGRYTFSVTIADSKNSATSNEVYLSIKSTSRAELKNISDSVPSLSGSGIAAPRGSDSDHAAFGNGADIVKLQGKLMDSAGNYFNDLDVYNSYPATTTSPTADDITVLNNFWKATLVSDGSKVTFVEDNAAHACPTTEPQCLLVKGITKTSPTDAYQVDVVTSATLAAVKVELNVSPYSENSAGQNAQTIYFIGGIPLVLKLLENGTEIATAVNSGTIVVPVGHLMVGSTYSVEAYADPAGLNLIPTPDLRWALQGTNTDACPTNPSTISGASGNFWVASGINATYTLQGVTTSIASHDVGGNVAESVNNAVQMTPVACAGDQGFALWVSVE